MNTKIAIAIALTAATAGLAAPGARAQNPVPASTATGPAEPHVTLAVLPPTTTVDDLASVPGIAPGLLSPGLGRVSVVQTYLDITQGNRVFNSLYDSDLGSVAPEGTRVAGWGAVTFRAASAPADIVPGLLGSRAAVAADRGIGSAALLAADDDGRIARADPRCHRTVCRTDLLVTRTPLRGLAKLLPKPGSGDLLIAFVQPAEGSSDLVAVGIAGDGFDGNLTSDSTRLRGYVLSTDIAPTILDRLGVPIPKEISGQPIHSEGDRDASAVTELGDRLAAIPDRRSPVIAVSVLAWLIAVALASLLTWGRAARLCASLLALSFAYLPLMLLLGGALEPSLLAERLLLGVGGPALAAVTLAALRDWRALGFACGLTTLACGADVIAGSPFTALSLLGPSPGLGVRFYGIGNELEAILAALIVLGTGAALAGFAPRLDASRAAVVFLVTGFVAAFVFGAGRFGADVGAVIVFPVGVAVAAAVLTRRRRTVLLAVAAPIAALALLALIDLVTGGDSHLTRSVLDAGGGHELGNVAERRLRLSERSFVRAIHSLFLPIAIALIALGVAFRARIFAWVSESLAVRAAFTGAVAATLVGTLANDSGALLLELGTGYIAAFLGFAWAQASSPSASGN